MDRTGEGKGNVSSVIGRNGPHLTPRQTAANGINNLSLSYLPASPSQSLPPSVSLSFSFALVCSTETCHLLSTSLFASRTRSSTDKPHLADKRTWTTRRDGHTRCPNATAHATVGLRSWVRGLTSAQQNNTDAEKKLPKPAALRHRSQYYVEQQTTYLLFATCAALQAKPLIRKVTRSRPALAEYSNLRGPFSTAFKPQQVAAHHSQICSHLHVYLCVRVRVRQDGVGKYRISPGGSINAIYCIM